ncbi:MAG: DUF5668 domain-containing protein [Lentimicrobium sp.]|jgi:predicted membrane protein|nr:DUF5668 domain-containing protein [Lentimicrobium sp.]
MDENNGLKNYGRRKSGNAETLVIGLLIIGVGLLYMLRNMGLVRLDIWHIVFSWPMLLLVVGLVNFVKKQYVWGGILLVLGLLFLQGRITGYDFFSTFWPLVVILVGFAVIFSNTSLFKGRGKNHIRQAGEEVIDEVCIFGGSDRNVVTPAFKGGRIVAVFGGANINLTQSSLAEGDNVLDVMAMFGGATLIVPGDWNVKFEMFNILGGFSDKRRNLNIDHAKVLVIKGVALFGGGEIKSY